MSLTVQSDSISRRQGGKGASLPRRRLLSLDRLRGFAIVLMVLSHVPMLWDVQWVNDSIGRAAMPLFMLVAGYLFRPRWSDRYWYVILGAGVSGFILWDLGWVVPGILVVYVLILPCLFLVSRTPLVGIVVGIVQVYHVPLGWSGYEPGAVLAFAALGMFLQKNALADLQRFGQVLPSALDLVGRWPLSWYVGHLILLWGLTAVM